MPVIIGLGILGPVFFAGMLLIALSQSSSATTRPHQENPGISSAFTWATDVIGDLWHKIVRTTVSHFAASHLVPIARWFIGLNTLVLGVFRMLEDAVSTTAAAVERIEHHSIPTKTAKAVKPVAKTANTAVHTARTANVKATSTTAALHRYQVKTDPKVKHATVAVDVAIPKQLGRINTRVGRVEKANDDLRGRTKALEDGAVKTWDWIRTHPLHSATRAMGEAVAVALAAVGFGMFRCRSWRNLGRSLKCSDANILSDLLAAATLAVGIVSLVELAEEEQKVISTVADAVRGVLEV